MEDWDAAEAMKDEEWNYHPEDGDGEELMDIDDLTPNPPVEEVGLIPTNAILPPSLLPSSERIREWMDGVSEEREIIHITEDIPKLQIDLTACSDATPTHVRRSDVNFDSTVGLKSSYAVKTTAATDIPAHRQDSVRRVHILSRKLDSTKPSFEEFPPELRLRIYGYHLEDSLDTRTTLPLLRESNSYLSRSQKRPERTNNGWVICFRPAPVSVNRTMPLAGVSRETRAEILPELCKRVTFVGQMNMLCSRPQELGLRKTLGIVDPSLTLSLRPLRISVTNIRQTTPAAFLDWVRLFSRRGPLFRGFVLTSPEHDHIRHALEEQMAQNLSVPGGRSEAAWREFLVKTKLNIEYTLPAGFPQPSCDRDTRLWDGIRQIGERMGRLGVFKLSKWENVIMEAMTRVS
jgi:hypothetical protein